MSPVKESKRKNPRAVLIGVAGIALGLILVLVLFVFAIPSLTESGTVEVQLGSSRFAAGAAESRAETIERDGPILFSDVASGNRDIFLQHTGDNDYEGWVAFDARRPGVGRECTLGWVVETETFRDPCDGTTVAADGEGLVHYAVEVTEDGGVVIDLATSTGGTGTP